MTRSRPFAALLLGLACTPDPRQPDASVDRVEHCRYDVRVRSERPLRLEVGAACRGRGLYGLGAANADVAAVVSTITDGSQALARRGQHFELDRARGSAAFRYEIDVEELALRAPRIDRALRSGDSVILPASSFLLYPLPLDAGVPSEVTVTTPAAFEFVTGLARSGRGYAIQAHEIPVATYSVFAPRARRLVRVGSAEIELAVLDGPLAVSIDELTRWLESSARAVADFYGRFPVARAFVSVVPVARRNDVIFGKLLPESAPGIALLIGSSAPRAALLQDWVLIHELFHLGGPSFHGEGKWFDEGLATYYEPIVRVRAGLYTERELWREFALHMPPALPAVVEHGLEQARDRTLLYWGGALYSFASDVAVRKRSQGRLGLEDGLRRVLANGGHASEVWSLADALAAADSAFPEPVLAPLAAKYAQRGAPFDLEQLFRELGVERVGGDVVLHDDAPLAWVRRAIVRGAHDLK